MCCYNYKMILLIVKCCIILVYSDLFLLIAQHDTTIIYISLAVLKRLMEVDERAEASHTSNICYTEGGQRTGGWTKDNG